MEDFEGIRPYTDEEVPGVIDRLVEDPELGKAAASLLLPGLDKVSRKLAHTLVRFYLRYRRRDFHNVMDLQSFLSSHMENLINETILDLEVEGLEGLSKQQSYLFISNHRDIFMDAGLINFVIRKKGHDTARVAVGDNLLERPFAADLIRLNKGFIVERSVTGTRAVFSALQRTSGYIKKSLEEGNSVWIAQREGRSKDGFDRTDPAIIKMLALSYRDGAEDSYAKLLADIRIVPVAISYEIDPCDLIKAHELFIRSRDGEYSKPANEDLQSIVTGMTGFKGRVKLHFAPPLSGSFENFESIAAAIDNDIVSRLQVFPTHSLAAKRLGVFDHSSTLKAVPQVDKIFGQRIADCPTDEREFLLAGYANLVRNKREISSG
tara:strand:- start:935 stop:2068 length:1134 start_codon:yes stop_codon:yes gene_type:complete